MTVSAETKELNFQGTDNIHVYILFHFFDGHVLKPTLVKNTILKM